MKKCSKCKIEKELDEFGNNKNNVDLKQRTCKLCVKEEQQKCYNKDKSKYKKRNELHLIKVKEWVDNYKTNNKCYKCNENRYWLLDFHHKDPNIKKDNIGTLRGNGKINILKEEIKKCVLLCKNCHSDFHYQEKINKTTIEEYMHP